MKVQVIKCDKCGKEICPNGRTDNSLSHYTVKYEEMKMSQATTGDTVTYLRHRRKELEVCGVFW